MDAYIFRGALYCSKCAREIKREVKAEWKAKMGDEPFDDDGDSEGYPEGPYEDGGGESDSPAHCDQCHVFLENSLTRDGEKYVIESVRRAKEKLKNGEWPSPVVLEWEKYYDYLDFGDDEEEEDEED